MAGRAPFDAWWQERVIVDETATVSSITVLRDWLAWCGKHKHMPGLGSYFFTRVLEHPRVGEDRGAGLFTGFSLREGGP